MTREQELIKEYEAAMNAPLSGRDKELMQSVLKWADNHPNWHKADKELPPPYAKVVVTDGNSIEYGWYDCYRNEWRGLMAKITHWMYLPELPKED